MPHVKLFSVPPWPLRFEVASIDLYPGAAISIREDCTSTTLFDFTTPRWKLPLLV